MRCSRCGLEKSPGEMGRNRSRKSGYDTYCKPCRAGLTRDWQKKHPDKVVEMRRSWYVKSTDKINVRRRGYMKRQLAQRRARVFEILGNACSGCGVSDARLLQVDHLEGGGHAERKTIGQRGMYKKIIETSGAGVQLLCANCHVLKHYGHLK